MRMDVFILINAFLCFLIFWIIHLWVFRLIGPAGFIRWLKMIYILGGVFNVLGSVCFSVCPAGPGKLFGGAGILLYMTLSLLIYGLLGYLYIVCFIGPYETSIRIRLIREISKAFPQGMRQDQILEKYNADIILRQRLDKLMGSGNIVLDGDRYRMGKPPHLFFFLNNMSCILKKLMKEP